MTNTDQKRVVTTLLDRATARPMRKRSASGSKTSPPHCSVVFRSADERANTGGKQSSARREGKFTINPKGYGIALFHLLRECR